MKEKFFLIAMMELCASGSALIHNRKNFSVISIGLVSDRKIFGLLCVCLMNLVIELSNRFQTDYLKNFLLYFFKRFYAKHNFALNNTNIAYN